MKSVAASEFHVETDETGQKGDAVSRGGHEKNHYDTGGKSEQEQ